MDDHFKLVEIQALWCDELVYFHVEMREKLILLS